MKITTNIIAVSLQITERGNESIKIILAILLFCVATIALSKFNNSDLFRGITKSFFRFKLIENNFNDEFMFICRQINYALKLRSNRI